MSQSIAALDAIIAADEQTIATLTELVRANKAARAAEYERTATKRAIEQGRIVASCGLAELSNEALAAYLLAYPYPKKGASGAPTTTSLIAASLGLTEEELRHPTKGDV